MEGIYCSLRIVTGSEKSGGCHDVVRMRQFLTLLRKQDITYSNSSTESSVLRSPRCTHRSAGLLEHAGFYNVLLLIVYLPAPSVFVY